MKKIIGCIGLLVVLSCIILAVGRQFYSDLYEESSRHSPNNRFTATVSYATYGGAAGGVQAYVQIQDTHTKEATILYSAKALQNVQLQWENEQHLTITNENSTSNATMTLDVLNDSPFENVHMLCKYFCKRPTS